MIDWLMFIRDAGGWGVAGAVVGLDLWLVLTGRLVPRSLTADWRKAAETAMEQNSRLLQTSRVVDAAFKEITPAKEAP